jgi:radical SAM-linked protein
VLLAAHRRGCRLDAWSEHLRLEPWREAFQEAGVDPDFYLREREADEVLPWDHLDSGVSREFLATERDRAYQELETPDCRQAGCQDCGVCDHQEVALRLHDTPAAAPAFLRHREAGNLPPAWCRLSYSKVDEARWLSHLELISVFYRSLRRSRLPLAFSDGFHPLPRVAFHGALAVGVESLAETLDVELAQPLGAGKIVETLNRVLPQGLKILHAQLLPRRLPPPRPESAVYRVASPEPLFTPRAAADFLNREEVLVTRQRPKKADKIVDLRHLVARLEVVDPCNLQLTMLFQEKDNLKVTDTLAHIFHLNADQTRDLHILKIRSS